MVQFGVNLNPPPRQLRQFAAILLGFCGLVGVWVLKKPGSVHIVAAGLCAVGLVLGLFGLLRPACIRPVYLLIALVTWPIGWLISYVLLALVYYGMVTPLAVVMRLFGRDPLNRRFDLKANTYWGPRPPQADVSRYFRQF